MSNQERNSRKLIAQNVLKRHYRRHFGATYDRNELDLSLTMAIWTARRRPWQLAADLTFNEPVFSAYTVAGIFHRFMKSRAREMRVDFDYVGMVEPNTASDGLHLHCLIISKPQPLDVEKELRRAWQRLGQQVRFWTLNPSSVEYFGKVAYQLKSFGHLPPEHFISSLGLASKGIARGKPNRTVLGRTSDDL